MKEIQIAREDALSWYNFHAHMKNVQDSKEHMAFTLGLSLDPSFIIVQLLTNAFSSICAFQTLSIYHSASQTLIYAWNTNFYFEV